MAGSYVAFFVNRSPLWSERLMKYGEWLVLRGTEVTDVGVAELRQAMPNVEIYPLRQGYSTH